MALTKYKLGELIEQTDERNRSGLYTLDDVKGISTEKKFIDTKANMDGVSLDSYKVVNPGEFTYVADTSRRGDKIALAYNSTADAMLISSIYTTFRICREDLLVPEYLFMFFNRPEFDRYARYNSWGSARETFSWDDFCDIDIILPSVEIQRKFAAVYVSLQENFGVYLSKVDDLRVAYTAAIEGIRKTTKSVSILPYIEERQEINRDCRYNDLKGVGNEGFIEPRGSRDVDSFHKCNIFYPKDFVYNPSVVAKGAIAYNNRFTEPKICTEEYIVFYVKDEKVLCPEYLFIWLRRRETGRFLEWVNMDSVRNRVYFRDLHNVKIPIPSIDVQKSIAALYSAYFERQRIASELKEQLNNLCPILIRGSILAEQ